MRLQLVDPREHADRAGHLQPPALGDQRQRWWSCSRCRSRSASSPTSCRCRSAPARSPSRGSPTSRSGSSSSAARLSTSASSTPRPRPASTRCRRSSDTPFIDNNGPDVWITAVGLSALGFTLQAINLIVTISQDARARPRLAPPAPLHLLGRRLELGAGRRRPGDARRADDAGDRPPLRRRLLRPGRGRRTDLLPAPELDLLHRLLSADRAPGGRRDLRDPPHLLAQAAAPRAAPSTASMAAIAVLGLLAWMQNMFTASIPIGWLYVAMAAALLLLVPFGRPLRQLARDAGLRVDRAAGADAVRARRDLDAFVRPRRRARPRRDPRQLAAGRHRRRDRRDRLRASSAGPSWAGSPRSTTGSRR